jgi:hypothetical protein
MIDGSLGNRKYATSCEHKDRKHYCRGFCRACYEKRCRGAKRREYEKTRYARIKEYRLASASFSKEEVAAQIARAMKMREEEFGE